MASGELDFRALFESAPALYIVLLPDAPRFTVVAASDAFLRATRRERQAIVGCGIFEVFPESPATVGASGGANVRASFGRVLEHRAADTMAVQKYDMQRPLSEGGGFEERFWSPVNSPALGDDGAVRYIIHRVEDVTEFVRLKEHDRDVQAVRERLVGDVERMEAEVFLRAQQLQDANRRLRSANAQLAAVGESQLRALFDFMPQLGWTAQPDGFIDFYNRGWHDYTGKTIEEMQGWGWTSVHDPRHLPSVIERWQRSIDSGTPFEMEFPLRRSDGEFRWFLTRVNPIRDSDGRIVRWVGINTDIHDRLVHTQESLRLRDEFLSIASHELKTPLTTMQLLLDSIARRSIGLEPGLARKLERLAQSSNRLGVLVETLLDVSRMTGGALELRRESFELGAAVRDVVERFSDVAARAQSPLVLYVTGEVSGSWDRLRVEQVVSNLLSNALKYAPGKPIEISVSSDENAALVSVADQGPGIAPEDTSRIFDRFERAASMRHYGGLGLGLYISRQIVEAHGGELGVQSEPGQGARFSVRLPLAQAA